MILEVKDIYKSYGKEEVLKGISFTIEKPEIIALVGPNGSGKTTLLNVISNLLHADQGEVTILGKDNKDPKIFLEMSFMQDNSVLYDYLTAYDHLQFIAQVQRLPKERIIETAKRIGMESYLHKRVKSFSLGMKQHLLLAMAIINQPKLLILDEPLNGLDPTSAIRVRELLLALEREGTAILLSSHNLAEIDRVTSKVLFLKDGKLIQEDLKEFEEVHYVIAVDQGEKAKNILNDASIFVEIEQDNLLLNNEEYNLHDVIALLAKNEVKITGIEQKILGSEERYRKYFADQLQSIEQAQ